MRRREAVGEIGLLLRPRNTWILIVDRLLEEGGDLIHVGDTFLADVELPRRHAVNKLLAGRLVRAVRELDRVHAVAVEPPASVDAAA